MAVPEFETIKQNYIIIQVIFLLIRKRLLYWLQTEFNSVLYCYAKQKKKKDKIIMMKLANATSEPENEMRAMKIACAKMVDSMKIEIKLIYDEICEI